MTTEEKAKAYDEALERARRIKNGEDNWRYSDLIEIIPALEEVLPELRESEDERIRKIITDSVFYQYGAGVEYKNVLDYLDKLELQKKKKDFRKLYEDIAKSEWFKKAYEGKSLECDHEQRTEECEYDKETSTQRAYREGQAAGRQEVFDHPGTYGLEKIDNVFGFRIGDTVRLVDGDGRPHIIKYFEKIEGLHGPDFYRAIFEDNTASDHIIPGDEYPNGYFTCMQKIDEQKEQKSAEWSEDFDKEVENIHKRYPEVSFAKLTRIAYHFSKWANRRKDMEWNEVEVEFRGEKVKAKRPFYRDSNGKGYSTTEQDGQVTWNALRAWCEKHGYTPFDLYPQSEWSEEDEKMIETICKEGDLKPSEQRWLKSLRPCKPTEDEERLINTSISFLKDFADKGYENAVECIDWLKSKSNGNSCK